MNELRAAVGLAPVERLHGGISAELALVATFPQLEYPRRWPAGVHVTGPMEFEIPHPDVELPEGDEPLVLVAPSTAQDPELRLLRAIVGGAGGGARARGRDGEPAAGRECRCRRRRRTRWWWTGCRTRR